MYLHKTENISHNLDELIPLCKPENFHNPFAKEDSYLRVFANDYCSAEFFNLQECDYNQQATPSSVKYIKTIMRGMLAAGRKDDFEFIKANVERFAIETNEDNYYLPTGNSSVIKDLESKFGVVRRVRIVRLPAGEHMPWHKDETIDGARVLLPIITNDKCINKFPDVDVHMPADGRYFSFDSDRVSHAVYNYSEEDRYIMIFSIKKPLEFYDK
jgi:hypothetical protein